MGASKWLFRRSPNPCMSRGYLRLTGTAPSPSSNPGVVKLDGVFFCDAQIEKFHAFLNNEGHDVIDLPTIRALVPLMRQCFVELVVDRASPAAPMFFDRIHAAFPEHSRAHSRFNHFLEGLENFMEQEDQDCLSRISRLLS